MMHEALMEIARTTNLTILIGPLGRDATRRVSRGGVAVIEFPLVATRRCTNDDGDAIESDTWHHIVYWGTRKPKSLKGIFPYLIQGRVVGVRGEIHLNEWEHDGEPLPDRDPHPLGDAPERNEAPPSPLRLDAVVDVRRMDDVRLQGAGCRRRRPKWRPPQSTSAS